MIKSAVERMETHPKCVDIGAALSMVKTHLSLLLCYSGVNADLPKSHCHKGIALLIAVAYGQHSGGTSFID